MHLGSSSQKKMSGGGTGKAGRSPKESCVAQIPVDPVRPHLGVRRLQLARLPQLLGPKRAPTLPRRWKICLRRGWGGRSELSSEGIYLGTVDVGSIGAPFQHGRK